jgi:hypothetical protein
MGVQHDACSGAGFCRRPGISRAQKLRTIKRGTTTLVLIDSIDEYMASLPAAFGTAASQAA